MNLSQCYCHSPKICSVPMELAGGVKHPQIERVNYNKFDFALLFIDSSQAILTGIYKLPAAEFV